mmetsp:Transcript_20599/g.48867  ORF Transcript_20599/g.48867 Transcript_20599/m.48867 type:complete len:142 (+) Transcript_20599:322-747(+)
MHEMMIEKGFTLKSEDEVDKIKREKQPLRLKDEMRRKQREEMRDKMINNGNWQTERKRKKEREAGVDPSDLRGAGEDDLYGDGLTPEQRADMEREMKRKKWNQVLQERERTEKQNEKDAAAEAAAAAANSAAGEKSGGDEL